MSLSRNIVIIALLIIPHLVFSQQELKGFWIRVDDNVQNPNQWKNENYDGAVIEIRDSGNISIGISIKVPQNAIEHGYVPGNIKWKDFQKISDSTFTIQGLLMVRGDSEKFNVPTYIKAYIKLESTNSLAVWTEDQSEAIGGRKQKWVRVLNN